MVDDPVTHLSLAERLDHPVLSGQFAYPAATLNRHTAPAPESFSYPDKKRLVLHQRLNDPYYESRPQLAMGNRAFLAAFAPGGLLEARRQAHPEAVAACSCLPLCNIRIKIYSIVTAGRSKVIEVVQTRIPH
jgi:hypothetical protein